MIEIEERTIDEEIQCPFCGTIVYSEDRVDVKDQDMNFNPCDHTLFILMNASGYIIVEEWDESVSQNLKLPEDLDLEDEESLGEFLEDHDEWYSIDDMLRAIDIPDSKMIVNSIYLSNDHTYIGFAK